MNEFNPSYQEEFPRVHIVLGCFLFDIDKAISIEPNFADSYAYRGDVKARQNDMEDACSNYKKSASLGYEPSAEWLKSDQGSWCRDLNSKQGAK